jgi:hypothetical protein
MLTSPCILVFPAFTQTRDFLMAEYSLTEFEAWTIITTGVDFSTTQLVDGNWGVHAVVPKALFSGTRVTCPRDFGGSSSMMITVGLGFGYVVAFVTLFVLI